MVYNIMALQLVQSVRKAIIAHRVTSSEATCGYITNAIQTAHGDGGKTDMLTVKEFIHFAKYPVVGGEKEKFYKNLQHDMPIFVTDELIDWMGFAGGKDNKVQIKRTAFMNSLNACDPHGKEHQLFTFDNLPTLRGKLSNIVCNVNSNNYTSSGDNSNSSEQQEEQEQPLEQHQLPGPSEAELNAMYPVIAKDKNTVRRIFATIGTDLLQKMAMRLKTAKGDEIREHFITCKKVLEIYMQYQTVYKELQYRIDMDNMQRKMDTMILVQTNTNQQLEKANVDRELDRINADEKHAQLIGNMSSANELDRVNTDEKHAQLMGELALARELDRVNANEKHAQLMQDLTLAREERDDAKDDTIELTDSVESLNSRISAAAPDHIHAPVSKALTHELLLYGNNSRGYRSIRTQHRSSSTSIKTSIALGYDRHVMTVAYAQGCINLWNVVKGSFTGASFYKSKCALNAGVEEEALVAAIHAANLKQRTL
jgi:hypothetical protein